MHGEIRQLMKLVLGQLVTRWCDMTHEIAKAYDVESEGGVAFG